jgi:hypothetical protein
LPGDREALGRSRGGYSTKLHLRVEGRGKPMVILTTAGQRHEAFMLRRLLEGGAVTRPGPGRPRIRPAAVAADKGSSSICGQVGAGRWPSRCPTDQHFGSSAC